MIYVSPILSNPPETYRTPLQQRVYETLAELSIPIERVDNEPAITMEDCEAIDARFGGETVKTLLVCNRQQTQYYLFVTPGNKPFVTKDFSAAMGISRVSFAPTDQLQPLLGTCLGATTVFSILLDSTKDITVVLDKAVADSTDYICTDGTTTGYMRLKTADLLQKVFPFAGRVPVIREV